MRGQELNQRAQQSHSASRQVSQVSRGDYESQAIEESILKWSSLGEQSGDVVISGESDISILRNLHGVLLSLQSEFGQSGSKIVITGEKKDQFNKRLILLEGEIQGLMKRKIHFAARDERGGTRVMDYTGLLNEKETQVVELEKKINNLQERLRRASAREIELENHITHIYADLKRKEEIILSKNEVILAEVASSNSLKESLNKIRRNIDTNRSRVGDLERTIFEGVSMQEVGSFEIQSDLLTQEGAMSRSKSYQSQSQPQKNKTQLLQLFREFERMNSGEGISDTEIERVMEGFLVGMSGSRIKESVSKCLERRKMQDDYSRLKQQFQAAVSIYQNQIDKIRKENPGIRLDVDTRLFEMLREQKLSVFKLAGDIVHLERFSERTVEVPVQDARTKHLMHILAKQMKTFTSKYPKLYEEMDSRLTEFFQQEMIDIIEVDELDRVVEIVKYVPYTVKVENVYAYSSEKSRKVEFHLRVLIKALLEELEKMRIKTGAVLEIDEGIIGMISQEIMGVVDIDAILKVFRVVPKIVEVQKIVEKIVDRIVEVPQVVPVERIIEKIVEVEKIKEVERIVNVPLEIPIIVNNTIDRIVQVEKIVERIVQVPNIIERIIEVVREVPKIVEVEKIIEKIVEVQKIIEVQRVVNHVAPQIQIVEVVIEKIVAVEKIVEKIVEVPVVVEKIVQKIVQIPQIIEVQKIVEKIVPVIEYRNAKEIENYIEVRNVVVDRIIEKPVPIIQIVEKIVEVPQIVQKIVIQNNTIRQPYEVEVIREKIVVQERIKEIDRVIEKPVFTTKEVVKEVERIIQVPIIHEVIRKVQEIIEKPMIQRIENTIIKEVIMRDPIIIKEPKIVEVQRIINHYIDVPKPIKYIEEKIVEVIRHVDRIKEIKVPVEKIIEKMVEVPKVVEVEKIVEKIVVVPRVIEKIVEVPQFIERIVPKVIIEERIKTVQIIIEKPVIQERVVEIEVPKNVYIEVEKVVEKIVDKLVEVPKYEERIITNQVIIEKVIEVIREIPRNMEVEKLVHNYVQVPQIVQIEKQIIVPIEVPVPVEKIIEKMVPMTEIIEKIVQVPQVVEKVVTITTEIPKIEEIVRIEEKIVIDTEIREIVKEVPYIRDQIKEVQTIIEKIVPVQSTVQEIVTAQQIIEKIVEKSTIVPKIYEVERLREKVIEIPKIVEIEKIVPQLINVNRYIQSIVEKIVEVPVIVEQIKEVVREHEKIVEVRSEYETVKEVEKIIEKAVIMEKFKEVVRNINHIEKVLQIVDRLEQTPVEIISHEEKLVQVPYILEKIVEKIVIMPQIVEVLKYVHEVVEEEHLGVAVNVDVATHEQRYKLLTKDLKINLDIMIVEMRKVKGTNPNLKIQIELIEKFLRELEQFILFPRIVQVQKEVIVEKIVEREKIVTLPTQNERSLKMELTLSLLVEQLIVEIKRIKHDQPNVNLQLEDDVKLIFFNELESGSRLVGEEFNVKLKSFSDSVYRKFESLGNWSFDHQMMLNSFLQERFLMANLIKNANLEIEKGKSISIKREEAVRKYESDVGMLESYVGKIRSSMSGMELSIESSSVLNNIFSEFDSYVVSRVTTEPTRSLGELQIQDQRIASLLRQKEAEIITLKGRLIGVQQNRTIGGIHDAHARTVKVLQDEILNLKNQNLSLRGEKSSVELVSNYQDQISQLNNRILVLEQDKSNLSAELSNLRREYEVRLQFERSDIFKDESYRATSYTVNQSPSQEGRSTLKGDISTSSPVHQYGITSPEIRMVESSSYRGGQEEGSSRGPTYGTTDDRMSGSGYSSGMREETHRSGTSYGVEDRDKGGQSTRLGASGISYQAGGSYQTGHQSGSGQGSVSGQLGSSVTYGAGSPSSATGQAGGTYSSTFQAGQTGQSGVYQGIGGQQQGGLQQGGLQQGGLQQGGLHQGGLQQGGLQGSQQGGQQGSQQGGNIGSSQYSSSSYRSTDRKD